MKSHEVIKILKNTSGYPPVKVEINGVLHDIKDIIWSGLDNNGCYIIKLKSLVK